ncbi:MAG TPA: deoxyguanosinetriphosphate triphosphohydrolase [Lachnospiraceae bacterium]|nr:deoxyguanosinetriphosphate triphosphohydrolase [Lachnospiraceae bacterium]
MEWKKLLSQKRSTAASGSHEDVYDLRSEFEKDYRRIIGSASFRRLQDKTQVFPLDKSDFIRTRLTHSLEVSSFGRSLAKDISESVIEQRLDPAFSLETRNSVSEVIECAGLIHDIGNPPFGHFGEEAIREWFRRKLPQMTVRGKKVTDYLSPAQLGDFYHFEGNAQGLRLVSRLHFLSDGHGMDLTYALLSAMIKYPNSSLEADPSSSDVKMRKMGYFQSEEELFRDIENETGLLGARSPLTFILEAADDIAYGTADIEDAFKKDFFDYGTFLEELKLRHTAPCYTKILTELYDEGRSRHVKNPQEFALMNWLVKMQDSLLKAAAQGFISHYKAIMDGTFEHELIFDSQAEVLLRSLKGIAFDYAFTSMSIYKTEIAANSIITYLLDKLVPAALEFDGEKAPGLMEEKFLSLISENYRQVYEWAASGKPESGKMYYRLLLATDTISGMTDSYARDLYTDLNGIT